MKVLSKKDKFVVIISFVKEDGYCRLFFCFFLGEIKKVKCVSSRLILPLNCTKINNKRCQTKRR
tara:strand:- start:8 stop:199 length:192 start_codon:yes stop_codon:yes gene_type:complete